MSYFKGINIEQDMATTGPAKTNLTGSQSYASDWFLSYNQSALQIVVLFDQNVDVYIDQAIDALGTQIIKTSEWPSYASQGLARSVASVAPYYRVRLVNQSASTATGDMVAVSTAVFNPLPIDTDYNDNLRVASPMDEYGWTVENTYQGEMRTVTPVRLVGTQMDLESNAGAVDQNFWITSLVNSATVSVAASLCSITSGTNAAGSAKLASIRRARYISGLTNRFRGNFRVPTSYASNTKRWGIANYSNYTFTITAMGGSNALVVGDIYSNNSQYFTVMRTATSAVTTIYMFGTGAPSTTTLTKVIGQANSPATITFSASSNVFVVQDGALFQADGATPTLTCTLYKNGTPTDVPFNSHLGSTYVLNTDIHTYEIYYTNTRVFFVIDGEPLATYSASTTGWTSTMHMQIFADNVNSGNTTTTTLGLRNAAVHRLGPSASAPITKYLTAATLTVLKYGPGNVKNIMINTWANGATIDVYDSIASASGQILSTTLTKGTGGNVNPILTCIDTDFQTGLTITMTGTLNITVNYE